MEPLVSVIIPTKNSARTIEACLRSVKYQDYKNIEIIVVDNFSTDGTQEIAKKYTEKVYEQWPERTAQKNYGISKSIWDYLCFIDSDMILSWHVISECVKKIHEASYIGGICIPEKSIGNGIFAQIRDFERSFYSWTAIESARFFRKEDVTIVWGFEEDLIFYEESLLPQKIESQLKKNCKMWIISHIEHNEVSITLIPWLKKKFYYGKSLSEYKRKSWLIGIKQTWMKQISILGRYLIFLSNKRFYSRPLLALWVLGLKTLEFSAGILGLLVHKFWNSWKI